MFSGILKSYAKNKYLIIAWAITNFTDVSTTFDKIIDVLKEKAEEFKKQKIEILVRRWWINKKMIRKIKKDCFELKIPAKILYDRYFKRDKIILSLFFDFSKKHTKIIKIFLKKNLWKINLKT